MGRGRTVAQRRRAALLLRAVAIDVFEGRAVCPICGAAYTPATSRDITCPPCYRQFVAAGLTWRERQDKVLTAKIKALLDGA